MPSVVVAVVFVYLFFVVVSYSGFMQQGIKSNPALVQKLRATFLKVRVSMSTQKFPYKLRPFTPKLKQYILPTF